MKLKLKNIGTLKQAEIDLSKDLIILAGPNNTGKTYAAYTVYGVCDLIQQGYKYELKNLNLDLANNLVSKLSKIKVNSINQTYEVKEIVKMFIDSIPEFFKINILTQLGSIFAVDATKFEDAEVNISFDENRIIEYLTHLEVLPDSISKTDRMKISKLVNDHYFKFEIETKEQLDVIKALAAIQQFNTKAIINSYFNNLYINTAERSAINIFSKELSIKRNNIVDQLLELRDSRNGDANQLLGKLQRYSLPIRDSMAISEDLANISRNKSEYAFLADRMEDVLLDGRINVSKYGEVQYSPNKSKVKNLSMNLSGSMVKSLSSLVIYFRHLAQKGDFIIIDEPELNLHPDNQRKVARLFGEIINQGFKVMISTHSDYIIRELNNLIMLKSGGEKAEYLAGKYGYEEKQLIDYQRVGAYLFNHNKNISLEVTETGFEVGTIDEVINELNNASEEIYFTLFD